MDAQVNQFVMSLVKAVLPGFLIISVLTTLAMAFKLLVLPKLKGKVGEGIINFMARRNLDPAVYIHRPRSS